MRYLIYRVDKKQDDCELTEMPSRDDFENADAGVTVIVDLQEGQRYFYGGWRACSILRTHEKESVRGWIEKGTTWQERALNAEHRLTQAYERMRNLDEEITKLKMELSEEYERNHAAEIAHQERASLPAD